MSEKERMQKLDQGLTYEEAAHGVQTSIATNPHYYRSTEPKHMRTGIDMSKADTLGLVSLLIDKGIFTKEEYVEYIRLSANVELTMRESQNPGVKFR